jgi:hypothetical protein
MAAHSRVNRVDSLYLHADGRYILTAGIDATKARTEARRWDAIAAFLDAEAHPRPPVEPGSDPYGTEPMPFE